MQPTRNGDEQVKLAKIGYYLL